MINDEQRELLIEILGPNASEAVLVDLHLSIKRAYVNHRPTEFRVMVGHRDASRTPGSLELTVGDVVNLVGHTTELYVPVEIISTPNAANRYYRGVVVQQLAPGSQFEVGDSVSFSEDQVGAPRGIRVPLARMRKVR